MPLPLIKIEGGGDVIKEITREGAVTDAKILSPTTESEITVIGEASAKR